MKKLIAVCTMILALGFVAGCPADKKEEPKKDTPAATEGAATTDTPTTDATPATPAEGAKTE